MKNLVWIGCALMVIACQTERPADAAKPALLSLDGKPYYYQPSSPKALHKLDSAVAVARQRLAADSSEENFIWLGRRYAYRYQYDSAMLTFDAGLKKYPGSFKLYRHRGHRHITLRHFDLAAADLESAARLMRGAALETEPDGIPNAINQPLSSTQFNVWYHLGLAYYLQGNFEQARAAYDSCMRVSINDDLLTATVDWLYMTHRRLNHKKEAEELLHQITDKMTIIENESYYRRLRMYQGFLQPEDVLKVGPGDPDADLSLATQGYGVGNWYLVNGDTVKALNIYRQVTDGKHFSAFGFIASEADLLRLGTNN